MAETLTRSRWVMGLARLSWLLIVLAYLFFFLTDLRLDYAQVQVPCQGADCNYIALSPAEFDALAAWGWQPATYALLVNGATVLAVAVSWLLAGLIFWRLGATRIGWAVSLALIAIPVSLISDVNNVAAAFPKLHLPSAILSQVGNLILLLFFYLFPNGRFYPRWAVIPFLVTWLGFIPIPLAVTNQSVLPAVIGILLLLAGSFQVLRYRHASTPLERQQTKWCLLGLFFIAIAFPVWFLFFGGGLAIPPGPSRLLASLGGWLASTVLLTMLPVTLAIAILRYRLWDIDLIIRRTLVYSSLTAMLALVYFGSVVVLQGVVRGMTGDASPLVIVLSTLLIAALFVPLRARVQIIIDRRFYRRKYDAARTLAAFGEAARDETDLARLSGQLQQTVHDTMQPANVGLWLRGNQKERDDA